MSSINGLVIRSQSGFFWVRVGETTIKCRVRGRLKKGRRIGDLVAIGDTVEFSWINPQEGVIESVLPRHRMLARKAPTARGEYQQVIIANPDQVVLVFSCIQPAPKLGMVDRYLVIAEKQSIPVILLVNKIDLSSLKEAQATFEQYSLLGYPVLYASAKTGEGMEGLRIRIIGKISVMTGPSGVGKSSLINQLLPDLALSANEVSQVTQKGRHTTVAKEMYSLPEGGYLADTPGLKALALWDIEPEELDGYFVELKPLVERCQFNDCTHVHEPRCAIIQAVGLGEVSEKRYQSYLRLRSGDEDED